ncbi:tRNA delta(2)-isopentenylpyrophosphate transferase, putative [Plasmodium gallinaceum]|uniref:tRNA dimethylallyltransferase n=1 Tax=Plasmodium gallinaceum TaxID=5849 RepID=A0A1J1GXW9_PLAGA|nr:tRNA delta(2)-isopentenylpyrophosphate transferase, putative [Plasmodium gallinaceum]CRG97328.1 tRNA delta(2)-isopentenylpyrophosphate transferase, putative [Plasmodium gallinaceum]
MFCNLYIYIIYFFLIILLCFKTSSILIDCFIIKNKNIILTKEKKIYKIKLKNYNIFSSFKRKRNYTYPIYYNYKLQYPFNNNVLSKNKKKFIDKIFYPKKKRKNVMYLCKGNFTKKTGLMLYDKNKNMDDEYKLTEYKNENKNISEDDRIINPNFYKYGNNKKKKEKIILIIGVTCSGKTKFSIDLSEELLKYNIHSEIISSDSMQVYQNFNIGIAKINEEEKRDIKHHLLDICHHNDTFNVHKFINYTIPIIKNINYNNKLAIITGGTLLYIESLLWESVIDLKDEKDKKKEKHEQECEKDNYEDKTNDELYEKLKEVDEERANQLHKNDRKRICRSLDIFYTYNKKHSELIKIKNHKNNKLDEMRYIPCFFYLDYDNDDTLKKEIEKRVDLMISKGLLDEVIKLKELNKNRNIKASYKGINQSIAYKEFDAYIEKKINKINDDNLFNVCKDNLIRKTYKYAKKQRRWIFNRFVKTYHIPLNKIDVTKNYKEQLSESVHTILKFLHD